MSRRNARRKNQCSVLQPLSRLGRQEREWARQYGDRLQQRAEQAMQEFKQSLSKRTLKSIGEFKSKKQETRAHMKRTRRPKASAVRHVPVTSENEQEALRSLAASCSKAYPPDGIQTVAADERAHTTERDHMQSVVRKQDDAVVRPVRPPDEKPASPCVVSVICADDAGAPKQAVTG
jgi:hypothetical protein